jgi:spore coat assembly protein SafA
MRYKNYIWPHNPKVYSIDYERKMAVNKTPFGLFHLQDLGRTNRIMEGEGEFVGEDAYAQFGQLANVFYDGGPGQLVHPLWQTANAYFVKLKLEQEPRPDYVKYSFTFWEDDSWYTALPTAAAQNSSGQTAASTSGAEYHTVVKGETMWGIAKKYGVTLSELVALNPQIKNPNLIYVGQEVRVK